MNQKGQSVSHIAFVTFCAFALVASMVLPMLGATPSYAEELESSGGEAAPSTEPQATSETEGTFKVEIGGFNPTLPVVQYVKAGEKVVKPEALPDTTSDAFSPSNTSWGKKRALFYGWYKSDVYSRSLGAEDGLYSTELFDFDTPVTEDMKLMPSYYIPCYSVSMTTIGPDGRSSGTAISILEGDTVMSKDKYSGIDTSLKQQLDSLAKYPGYTGLWYYRNADTVFDLNTPIMERTEVETFLKFVPGEGTSDIPVSGSTGITANGSLTGTNVPEGSAVELAAVSVTSGSAYSALMARLGSGYLAGAFEVTLAVNGKQIHDGFGSLEVTFPVSEKYNGHWVTVLHRHNDGTITSERVIAKDSMVTVTVSDLSTFALEVGGLAKSDISGTVGSITDISQVSTSNPSTLAQTGDSAAGFAVAGIAAIALAVVFFTAYRGRKAMRS